MNWTLLALVTIGAGIVTSLSDWFFAGDWLHRRWTHPEIWRQGVEAKAIGSDQSASLFDLWSLFLCHRPGGHSFCRGRDQTGYCRVVDRPAAVNPHECGIHEAASGICGVLLDWLAIKAHNCCGCNWLVPSLTGRPNCSSWSLREDGRQTFPYQVMEGYPVTGSNCIY